MRITNRSHILSFSGGHVSVPAHPDFDLTDTMSFIAWVRPNRVDGQQATLLSKDYTAFEPQIQNGAFVLERGPEYAGKVPIATGKWVKLAATFNRQREGENLRLYVDGVLDSAFAVATPLATNGLPLLIGKRPRWDDGGGLFDGELAGIALWNSELTPWQIRSSVNSPVDLTDGNLIAYWPMDEASGNRVPDLSGRGHHGTIDGAVTWLESDGPIIPGATEPLLKRNTSIYRLTQISEQAKAAAQGTSPAPGPDDTALVSAPSLPPTGRNGAAFGLLNRARQIHAERVKALQAEQQTKLKQARADADMRKLIAHREACRKINSTRFDALYFLADGILQITAPDHTSSPFLVNGAPVRASCFAIDPARKFVFWAEPEAPFYLRMASFDGQMLAFPAWTSSAPVSSLALEFGGSSGGNLYRIVGASTIVKSPIGAATETVVRDIRAPAKDQNWQLDIDNDSNPKRLYWTNDSSIWSCALDGSDARMVVSSHHAPFPIDLKVDGEAGFLYWVDRELGMVRRARLDGSVPEDLYRVVHPLRGLSLDEITDDFKDELKKEIYWSGWEDRISATTVGIVGNWPLDEGLGDGLRNTADRFTRTVLTNFQLDPHDPPPGLPSDTFVLKRRRPRDFIEIKGSVIDRLHADGFSACFWVKFNSDPVGEQPLLFAGRLGYPQETVEITLTGGKLHFGFGETPASTGPALHRGVWNHVACVYDPSAKGTELKIYLNGKAYSAVDGSGGLELKSGSHLYIGKPCPIRLFGAVAQHPTFDGVISDLHIATKPLTIAQVEEAMTGKARRGLHPGMHDGDRWERSIVPPVAARPAASLRFTGPGDYALLGDAKTLQLSGGSFTVEAWIRPQLESYNQGTIVGGESHETGAGLHLQIRDHKPYLGFYGDDLAGQSEIPDHQWTHIAWRFDAATLTQSIVVNGHLDSQRQASAPLAGSDEIYLGRSSSGYFLGLIANLRIWNAARTDEEIRQSMRNHRETFVMRGAVDGSGPVETLFEVSSDGGLYLLSQAKTAHERRLIAFRARQQAHEKAMHDIAVAQDAAHLQIQTKRSELQDAHTSAQNDVASKNAEHAATRTQSRGQLATAKIASANKIEQAKQGSAKKHQGAVEQAGQIKDQAHATASTMKSSANKKRDDAQKAFDQY
jgi:hypothetical protein